MVVKLESHAVMMVDIPPSVARMTPSMSSSPRFPRSTRDSQCTSWSDCLAPISEWQRPFSAMMEQSARSPTSSSCSRDSFIESENTRSTAPSSPRSPVHKYESFDYHQLNSIPSKSTSLLPENTTGESMLAPFRRGLASDALPSLDSVLSIPRSSTAPLVYVESRKRKYSHTPEPAVSGEYVYAKDHSYSQDEDPIMAFLNKGRRQRLNDVNIMQPVPDLHRIPSFTRRSTAGFDYSKPRSSAHVESYNLLTTVPVNHQRNVGYGDNVQHLKATESLQNAESITPKKKRKNLSHCNKRYTREQKDYIRYHMVDIKDEKISWNVLQTMFDSYYPDVDFERFVQGLQGCYYRQNKDQLPEVARETNRLVYMPNGHVKIALNAKCRDQKDKKRYGMVNLFPERALNYPWVREEHRRMAAEIASSRLREREEAKQLAIRNGLWEETTAENSCACCIDSKNPKSCE
ncbi:hypothetical protein BX600DRAFT_508846 [Xylariales sp. PMI_506]|nr:hypothetical protein BX600DRAFT_508846 [Xylariales sp. PMI_506]